MVAIRNKVFLVDDNIASLTAGRNMLKTFYEVYPVPSAAELFELLQRVMPDLILLDIEMPELDGYETIKRLKANDNFAHIPVVFLTSKSDSDSEISGFDLGAVDYVSKPFSGPLLLKRIENQLIILKQKRVLLDAQKELKDYAVNLQKMVLDKTKEISHLHSALLTTVANLVELRDNHTGGHVKRTQMYARTMLAYMIKTGVYKEEISGWDVELFLASVQLHDVGKISISDAILNKPGLLTDDEMAIMRTHVNSGVDAVEEMIRVAGEHTFLRHTLLVVGTHHEKWDGTGYPMGLRGKNIPLEGRIMAIADVYDALVSVRSYKVPMSHEKACSIVETSSGTHFDPELVEVFRRVKERFNDIREGG